MTLQQNCRQGKVLGGGKRAAVRRGVGSGGSATSQSAELIVIASPWLNASLQPDEISFG